ncbi:MAG TPA: ATP-binding protein [Albidovulum sp.]|nr:ATP-binding protein [Albidovulum sp.]
MGPDIPDQFEAARATEEFRNTPDGLFLRYCRGRLRSLAQRQILTLTGGLAIAALADGAAAIAVIAIVMIGEGVDCLVLREILRRTPIGPVTRGARIFATATAAFQALTIVAAACLTLRSAEGSTADFFVAAFLASAVINAGLSLPHSPATGIARVAIHMSALLALSVRNLVPLLSETGVSGRHGYDLVGIAVLMIMATGFLSFVRGAHRRQIDYEHALIDEKARLQTQEARARQLALVAEHANDSVVITRGDGRIIWVNETFTRITGYSAAEAIGSVPADLLNAPQTDPATARRLAEAHRDKRPLRTEVLNRRKDGSVIWMETSLTPIFGADGRHTMTIAVERDISSMKEREAELARARQAAEDAGNAKARFLATMSHEIRTPMNGVIGMAELLRDGPLTPEQMHAADTIIDSGRALLAIINDILDLARLQSGKPTLRALPFSVTACIAGVVDLMRPLAREKGIALCAELVPSVVPVVGDDGRLRQVLVNLVGNAIKFTDAGRVTVRLRARRSGGTVKLAIVVADTGIGIPENRQEQIFDSFTQADGDITRRFGGTGLGLTISRLLAQEMGGGISLRSRAGAGSVFRLALSLPVAEILPAAPAPTQGPLPTATAQGLRVLVAEDNATNRLIVGRMLEATGAVVTFAEDGQAAVASAGSWRPDVIFMDLSMPGMGGLEATRRIRASERAAARKPAYVVALTANAFDEDRRACAAGGFDAFLPKPLNRAELLACLTGPRQSPAANGL